MLRGEVGRDRHNDEVARLRVEDRPADRERVGGAAGGRRDDDAVAAVVGDADAVDVDGELDGAAEGGAADDGLVEAGEGVALCRGRAAWSIVRSSMRPAPLSTSSRRSRICGAVQLREEAEAAKVDAENGGAALDDAGGRSGGRCHRRRGR